MKYFIFNLVDGDRERAASFLNAKRWVVGREERHRDALASGDLVLVFVAVTSEFVGRGIAQFAARLYDRTLSTDLVFRYASFFRSRGDASGRGPTQGRYPREIAGLTIRQSLLLRADEVIQ